jgi:hypothetical protein
MHAMSSAAAIAFLLLLCACDQRGTESPLARSARYQFGVDAEGNVWRMDTVTGEVKRCWQGTQGTMPYPPTCYTAQDR